MPNIEDETLN